MLELARNRVYSFEEEYQKVIDKLTKSEVNIQGAVELRSKFLANQEKISILQNYLFRNRVNILEKHLELIQLNLMINKFELEGSYEELQLHQLIAGTHQTNFLEVENIMRGGANQLIHRLQASILLRQDLVIESKLLLNRLDHLRADHENSRATQQDNQSKLLNQLSDDFTTYNQKSSLLLRKLVEDSLILRHNSRLAADILGKRFLQNDVRENTLNDSLTQLQVGSDMELYNIENELKRDSDINLQLKRAEIMRREGVLESLLTKNSRMKLESKERNDRYLALRKSADFNYNNLQGRRREELMRWKMSLEQLRMNLQTAESVILNPQSSYTNLSMECSNDRENPSRSRNEDASTIRIGKCVEKSIKS